MASVDGLVTGMSTTDTINQLMQIEAAPQAALKTKITTANKVVTAYQSISTRLSSIASAAAALNLPDTWGSLKAASSSEAAVASTKAGAVPGTVSFHVTQLATTQVQVYTGTSVGSLTAPSPSVLAGSVIDVVLPGPPPKPQTLTPKDGSLQSVISAINGQETLPYRASAVLIGPGQYALQIAAKESGTAGAAKVAAVGLPTGLNLGPEETTVAAVDAMLSVAGPKAGTTFDVISSSNNFTNVLTGVTITAAKVQDPLADPPVTITLTPDGEGMAAKVQALIDNANVALSEIAAQSKIKSGDAAAGALVGDSAMRKLTQDILATVSSGAAGLGMNGTTASFNDIGIGVARGGTLTFNKKNFIAAYEADPVKTQQYFDQYEEVPGGIDKKFDPGHDKAVGLARKLETLSLVATVGVADPTDATKPKIGILQGLIQRRNDNIRGLNDQVAQWDLRLELRKTNLQKQFSSLEVAMGKMQQQSSWLASQLAGLG
jgi:flagellar hook-associated protein 2